MGKKKKKQKENHVTKVTKIPKTKRHKYGMKETNENFVKKNVYSGIVKTCDELDLGRRNCRRQPPPARPNSGLRRTLKLTLLCPALL